ncbi:hypothetical protein HK096_008560, partial [Nowakowskiella sp. JEL0078]
MALKVELETWQEGVSKFESEKWPESLEIFDVWMATTAKIHFNIGMIFVNANKIPEAIRALNQAIDYDTFFAVAYFQRGACFFSQDLLEEAMNDFNQADRLMLDNTQIDYTQLGLDFKLFSFEILFNRGLCYAALGDTRSALKDFNNAVDRRPSDMREKYKALDDALRMDPTEAAETLNAFMVPRDKCYKPSASKMKNTPKIDFLGQSKVVAAVDINDSYTGFSGKALRETLGRTPSVGRNNRVNNTIKQSKSSDRIAKYEELLDSNSRGVPKRSNTIGNSTENNPNLSSRKSSMPRKPQPEERGRSESSIFNQTRNTSERRSLGRPEPSGHNRSRSDYTEIISQTRVDSAEFQANSNNRSLGRDRSRPDYSNATRSSSVSRPRLLENQSNSNTRLNTDNGQKSLGREQTKIDVQSPISPPVGSN